MRKSWEMNLIVRRTEHHPTLTEIGMLAKMGEYALMGLGRISGAGTWLSSAMVTLTDCVFLPSTTFPSRGTHSFMKRAARWPVSSMMVPLGPFQPSNSNNVARSMWTTGKKRDLVRRPYRPAILESCTIVLFFFERHNGNRHRECPS